MNVFEERSSYDPKKDSVAVVTVTVECAPGQVVSLIQHAGSFASQAGVYSVNVASEVREPVVEVPVEEPVAVAEPVAEPEVPVVAIEEVAVVQKEEGNGEQPVEQSDGASEAEHGTGQEAAVERAEGAPDQHPDGELAGTAGAGAEEGPVERGS